MEQKREIKRIKLNETDTYEGEVNADNLPDGKGKLICKGVCWYERYVYEGEFKDGKKHGKGVLKYRERRYRKKEPISYEGEWKEDKRDGYGKWKGYMDCYEGEWKDDEFHGRGVLKSHDGNVYEGDIFVEDKIKGRGKITYANGETYEGDFMEVFEDGVTHYKRSGFGVMTYQDGHVIEGQWIGDEPFDEALLIKTAEFSPEMINDFCSVSHQWQTSHMDWPDDQNGFTEFGFKINGCIRGFMWRHEWSISGYTGGEYSCLKCGLADDQIKNEEFLCSIVCDLPKPKLVESEYMLPSLLEHDEKGRIVFYGVHKDGVRHGLGTEFFYDDNDMVTKTNEGLWQNGIFTHRRSGGTLVPVE